MSKPSIHAHFGLLLLTDDKEGHQLASHLQQIEAFSFRCFTASNQKEFEHLLKTEDIRIVVAESNLKPYGGEQALAYCTKQHLHVPVIICFNSITEQIDALNYLRGGATGFVFKDTPSSFQISILQGIHQAEIREKEEEHLHKVEGRYDTLVQSQTNCVHELDLNGCFVSMNKIGLDMLGLTNEADIKGLPYLKVVSDEDRPNVEELLIKAYQGHASRFEFRGAAKEPVQHFSSSFIPLKNGSDKVERILGITADITKRKESELGLIIRDRAFDNIDQGILVTDPNKKDNPVIYVNKTFKRITGYAKTEILGENCRFLQGKETNKITVLAIQDAVANDEDYKCEILYRKKDGSPFWCELTITGIKNKEGKLTNYVRMLSDISKRKRTEEQLKKLSTAIDQSPASVVMTDLDGKINYVNPRFEEITGFAAKKVIGKNPRLLKSGHTSKEEYIKLWETITAGKTWEGEFHNKKRDGTLYWEKASIGPIFNEKGEITDYLAVKEDITEMKETQAVLKDTLLHLEDLVDERTKELREAKESIEKVNEEFISSLHYAQRIQEASLPSKIDFKKAFKDHFVVFKPRDIVSGDFYWLYKTGNEVIVVMADCTGHGVPGALMSMAGHEQISHIVIRRKILRPDIILEEMNQAMTRLLKRKNATHVMNDGMDMSVVRVNYDTKFIEYSGAQSHGVFVRGEEVIELIPDRNGIGGLTLGKFKDFSRQRYQFEKGDMFYLFSDGVYDQFGGEKGKKMLRKKFTSVLLENLALPMTEQGKVIDKFFEEWKGEEIQLDDIAVMGIEL